MECLPQIRSLLVPLSKFWTNRLESVLRKFSNVVQANVVQLWKSKLKRGRLTYLIFNLELSIPNSLNLFYTLLFPFNLHYYSNWQHSGVHAVGLCHPNSRFYLGVACLQDRPRPTFSAVANKIRTLSFCNSRYPGIADYASGITFG